MPVVTSTRTVRTIISSGDGGSKVSTTTYVDGALQKDGQLPGLNIKVGGKFTTPRSQCALDHDHSKDGHVLISASRNGEVTNLTYEKLKSSLVSSKKLFEDPDFPAVDSSLYFKEKLKFPIEWKRPSEICSNPKFIVGGSSRFDVRQGSLGDCWLLAAIASLSIHSELFERVVLKDQDFDRSDYCGMFRFHFWRFGVWQEVVVDDRLPTYRNQLVYINSADNNEFWSALLEKAYAKISGSYEALAGGSQSEAMEDFTGGICEMFELKGSTPKDLFNIILRAQSRCSLMGCSIDADPNVLEARMSNGLIKGHAYSITDAKMVDLEIPGGKKGKIPLLRIRNPWGNEAEWKGAWGDQSREWQLITAEKKQSLGLTFSDDGEFWMSYTDFVNNFEKLEICHLGPQSMGVDQAEHDCHHRWEMSIENNAWKRKLNAGGCRNFPDTFWTNPQYRVTVVDPDEDEDEDKGTLIIGLMQKNMRRRRKEGVEMHTIGYAIYQLKDPKMGLLDLNFIKYNRTIDKSAFINLREVCGRHKLPPGSYVVIPSTFDPDMEAEFILRIFSEKPQITTEVDEDNTTVPVQPPPEAQDDAKISALKQAFKSVAGTDMEIDSFELKNILDAAFKKGFNFDGFTIETARSLLAMMDLDQSGKLGFDEFKSLWLNLTVWKNNFTKFDVDKSGNFNSSELRQALNSSGYRVSNVVYNSLVMRYASREGVIRFDDYILICARLKTIFETFDAQKKAVSGEALFDKETFVQCLMYA